MSVCVFAYFVSSYKVIWKPRIWLFLGIHRCFIKALGVIDSSLKAAWFSAVVLAGAKDQRSDENQESRSEKEGVDRLPENIRRHLPHSSPARRVTRRLAAPWQCRGQEVNRHVVHGELKLIETRRRMTRSKVKVTQQQGRHRWRAAHFLRQTVVINQTPTAERKQFNPQHVVAGTDTNWGAYKLVSLQDPSFKLELALTQNRIIIVQ